MINDYDKQEYLEYLNAKSLDRKRKAPLVFAILGLLLGVFMGGGVIFSLISLSLWLRYKKLGGTSLKWTLVLGVVGLVLNLAFIVSLELIIILSKTPMPL